jgi:hypothetical protein
MPRAKFEPTEEQRAKVEVLAGIGLPEERIAIMIGPKGIDPKTLRKHFSRELLLGPAKAQAKVMQTFLQMATSGNCVAATIFCVKFFARLHELSQAQKRVLPERVAPEQESRESDVDIDQRIREQLDRAASGPPRLELVPDRVESKNAA